MSEKIRKAIKFAGIAHKNQIRKVSEVPYIIHPYTVGMILAQSGCREEIVIAGILHDTLEDTDIKEKEIKDNFGEEVLNLVKACSEEKKSEDWETKKIKGIEKLKNSNLDVKIICLADKLNNLKSIEEDYEIHGEEIWSKFTKGKEKQEWYYRSLCKAFSSKYDEFCENEIYMLLYNEFKFLIEVIFEQACNLEN